MANKNASSAGCLGLIVLSLPFFWLWDKCTGGDERRAREAAEERARTEAHSVRATAIAEQNRTLEAAAKERERKAAAELAREETTRIAAMKPHRRAALLVKCVKDSECPLGRPGPDMILEAAATKSEPKQLEATVAQLEKARERAERAEARASAPLLCCDGTASPSCSCGNPKRGCCSHHGGCAGVRRTNDLDGHTACSTAAPVTVSMSIRLGLVDES